MHLVRDKCLGRLLLSSFSALLLLSCVFSVHAVGLKTQRRMRETFLLPVVTSADAQERQRWSDGLKRHTKSFDYLRLQPRFRLRERPFSESFSGDTSGHNVFMLDSLQRQTGSALFAASVEAFVDFYGADDFAGSSDVLSSSSAISKMSSVLTKFLNIENSAPNDILAEQEQQQETPGYSNSEHIEKQRLRREDRTLGVSDFLRIISHKDISTKKNKNVIKKKVCKKTSDVTVKAAGGRKKVTHNNNKKPHYDLWSPTDHKIIGTTKSSPLPASRSLREFPVIAYNSTNFSFQTGRQWNKRSRLVNNVFTWERNARKLTSLSRKLRAVRGEGRESFNSFERSITSLGQLNEGVRDTTLTYEVPILHRFDFSLDNDLMRRLILNLGTFSGQFESGLSEEEVHAILSLVSAEHKLAFQRNQILNILQRKNYRKDRLKNHKLFQGLASILPRGGLDRGNLHRAQSSNSERLHNEKVGGIKCKNNTINSDLKFYASKHLDENDNNNYLIVSNKTFAGFNHRDGNNIKNNSNDNNYSSNSSSSNTNSSSSTSDTNDRTSKSSNKTSSSNSDGSNGKHTSSKNTTANNENGNELIDMTVQTTTSSNVTKTGSSSVTRWTIKGVSDTKYSQNSGPPKATETLKFLSSNNKGIVTKFPDFEPVHLAMQDTTSISLDIQKSKSAPVPVANLFQNQSPSSSVRLRFSNMSDLTRYNSAKQMLLSRRERSAPENSSTEFDDVISTNVSAGVIYQDEQLPVYKSQPIPVHYVFLMPFEQYRMFSLPKVVGAIDLAFDQVKERDLLPTCDIYVDLRDSRCSISEAMNEAINVYDDKLVDVFIGPVCDYAVAPIARQIRYWQKPLITPGALAGAFGEEMTFPFLIRVGANFHSTAQMMVSIMDQYKWNRIKIIYDPNGLNSIMDRYCFVGKTTLIIKDKKHAYHNWLLNDYYMEFDNSIKR
ncbi:atrial natriuretic peptide receptor 3-like [Elysia marginata]|uniref:Atrial natriuretic peptide receptor 3-like n=1 Tax=Elysia marginata TaxID=1093978 RepID=A0AAV4FJH5_9GAST|nr:atrial natriuretic peptide receptor 3-like [Elysia marginata]